MRRRTVPRTLAGTALLLGVLVAPAPTTEAATKAATEVATCSRPVPAATDGRLQLATPQVQHGGEALLVLSGFRQWPQGLVGGGSGETFLSCTPWQPYGAAEVMPVHEAALLLVAVPRSAAPGRYDLSVLFRQGSRTASEEGRLARLSVSVMVTADAPRSTTSSPVCALTARPASVGALLGPSGTRPGATAALHLVGVPSGRVTPMNEYDRLWWIACTAGTPWVLAHGRVAPTRFSVTAPTAPGSHPVTVFGIVDGRLVRWSHPLTVTAPSVSVTVTPPTTPSRRPSPTRAARPVPAGSDHGSALLLGGALAALLMSGGALALARRRGPGR